MRHSRAAGSASKFSDPTTAARPGSPSITSSPMKATPAPINGMTARPIPGNSSVCGTSSPRSPIPRPSMPEWKMRPCSARLTAEIHGTSFPACAATAPARTGSPVPVACASTRSCSIPRTPGVFTLPSRLRAPSAPTTAASLGGRSTAGSDPNTYPTPMPKSVTACTGSRCTPRARRSLHAETLGRHAQR